MLANETKPFRELCRKNGIAVTHQRQVLYETMKTMHGHPSPEEVYARVKKKVPAISLATVYKNIHLFVDSGVFQKVSMHHGSVRVEMNGEPHHHMVCLRCRKITDIGEKELGHTAKRIRLPGGFLVERYAVDAIGVCANCQKT
jgi:Fur family transcriptional regulator, peroxide stress response regulator